MTTAFLLLVLLGVNVMKRIEHLARTPRLSLATVGYEID
jgi:hypothetical protein